MASKPIKAAIAGIVFLSVLTMRGDLQAQPGSASDPLVTKSFVDSLVDKEFSPVAKELETLQGRLKQLQQRVNTVADEFGPFTDTKGHWAAAEIIFLADKGIVGGFPDGTFKPKDTVTRAQMASMLVRAVGLKSTTDSSGFTDVTDNHWASKVIATAKAKGIIGGYEDGSFRPSQPVTRQEIASMVARAFAINADDKLASNEPNFSDVDKSWAKRAILDLAGAGVLGGYPDGTFKPKQTASRAEVTVVIAKAIDPTKRIGK